MEWWFYYENVSVRFQYWSYLIKILFLIGDFVKHIESKNEINILWYAYVDQGTESAQKKETKAVE